MKKNDRDNKRNVFDGLGLKIMNKDCVLVSCFLNWHLVHPYLSQKMSIPSHSPYQREEHGMEINL